MRTFLVIGVSMLALTAARAADLPMATKAPVYAPVPGWQGFYIGASAGYGFSPDTIQNGVSAGFTPIVSTNSLAGAMNGATVGGRIGYDLNFGTWVAGIESDIAWANFDRSASLGATNAFNSSSSESTDWWGSTNIRIGLPVLNEQALIYALGGVAYGGRSLSVNGSQSVFTPASAGGVSASSTGVGWDVGAGLALKIDRNSEVFVEGRWIDLGSMNATLILPGRAGAIAASDDQRFGFAVVQAGYAFHF